MNNLKKEIVVIGFFMLLLTASCTETITEPIYLDSDTVYVYSDTTVVTINIQVNAILKILVTLPDGTVVNDAIITVVVDGGEWAGTMLYQWPGFEEDGYYRWVMPYPQSLNIFVYIPTYAPSITAIDTETGLRYGGKDWANITTGDFKITRWHNLTVKEANRWRFEVTQ